MGDARAQRPLNAAPGSEIESQLCDIWKRVLSVSEIDVEDAFFDLGGNSLLAIEVIAAVKDVFGSELAIDDLVAFPTVSGLSYLLQTGATRGRGSLVRLKAGEGTPVYLFHPVGGTVIRYGILANALGSGRPVWGLRALGFHAGEALSPSIEAMTSQYLEHMTLTHPGGPWHLVGFSLGGLVAFEAAQQLRASGEAVGALVLLDAYPLIDDPPTLDAMRAEGVRSVAENLLQMTGVDFDHLKSVPFSDQTRSIVAHGIRSRRLPTHYDASVLERLLNVRINNVGIGHQYRPREYSGGLVLLGSTGGGDDGAASRQNARRWRQLARSVAYYEVNCTHREMLAGDNAPTVVSIIKGHVESFGR
jgi:thioesterase domain-containing protein/acyl carrier protein